MTATAHALGCATACPFPVADGAQCMDYVPNGLHLNHVDDIARLIRPAGFNTVRLQWSNEMVALNPLVATEFVAANPQFYGRQAAPGHSWDA